MPAIHVSNQVLGDISSSGAAELEQRLAERALQKQMQARLTSGILHLSILFNSISVSLLCFLLCFILCISCLTSLPTFTIYTTTELQFLFIINIV